MAVIATVAQRPFARRAATEPPARSICDSTQPPKMSPLWLASCGIGMARNAGSYDGGQSGFGRSAISNLTMFFCLTTRVIKMIQFIIDNLIYFFVPISMPADRGKFDVETPRIAGPLLDARPLRPGSDKEPVRAYSHLVRRRRRGSTGANRRAGTRQPGFRTAIRPQGRGFRRFRRLIVPGAASPIAGAPSWI